MVFFLSTTVERNFLHGGTNKVLLTHFLVVARKRDKVRSISPCGSLYALQELAEFLSGNRPVTDLILDIITHLGKGLGIAFGDEYRVIAET